MEERTEKRTIQVTLGRIGENGAQAVAELPGYELEERLGAGGYGEVWRARTPDGLQKAIKVVYGMIEESRAMAERKSLERVKGVRHPFILTLERIEVLDERLVVVTELADKSLRDRFEECHRRIPRDELMRYLSDAAEALDYMFEEHSLQHLDIKPENLLLLGSHVKVADFGLTKTLGEGTMSEVSGLTPNYVAPEVLEGHPSQHSDQYSLAVVFQTMLTGNSPFRGRTTAQLISQHLHSPPDLSGVPSSDQSVIARALSKNPERRFGSCREFVEQLKAADQQAPVPVVAKVAKKPTFGKKPRIHVRQLDASEAVLEPQPAVALDKLEPVCRPTLVIGVGGVAQRVLRAFRRRQNANPDETSHIAPVELLYLDTDEREVSQALHGHDSDALKYSEVLAIPLRAPASYRSKFKTLGEWMPRRWLFNIPRSGLTEGIRPLGRLAFVDHYREIRRRISEGLSRLVSDEVLEPLRDTKTIPVDGRTPRVFLVASLGGGTGSGAVLDAAYTVKSILSDLELNDDDVNGVLLQPQRETGSNVLSAANATACLREFHHYALSEYYTGDTAIGIPTLDYTQPFDRAYFVPNSPDPSHVAEYLYRSLSEQTAPVFDDMRKSKPAAEGDSVKVRSFAVSFHEPPEPIGDDCAEDVTEEVDPTVVMMELQPVLSNDIAPSADEDGVELLEDADDGASEADTHLVADGSVDTHHDIEPNPAPATEPRPSLEAMLDEARQRAPFSRGTSSLIISVPTTADVPPETLHAIETTHGAQPTLVGDPAHREFICCEIGNAPLADFAALLNPDSDDVSSIAEQLHARLDVEW